MKPHDKLMITLVMIIAFGYVFQALNVIDLWFQSQLQSKYTAICSNIVVFLFFLAKIILVILHGSLITLTLILTLEIIFSSVGLFITYKLLGFTLRSWRFSSRIALSLLKDSWPLILSGLAIMVYMRIDQIMIGNIIGEREVGIYSAAVRISEIWYFIPMAIFSSVYPKMIEYRKQSQYLYFKRSQQLFNFMVILGYSVGLFFVFFSKTIVNFLFGSQYLQASNILSVHIWTGVFVSLGVVSSQFLLVENYTKLLFHRTALGAIFNIVFNLALIPKYGGVGAAISTLISQFIVGYLFDIFNNLQYYRKRKWFEQPEGIDVRMVCSKTGLLASDSCTDCVADYYLPGITNNSTCQHKIKIMTSLDGEKSYCLNCLPKTGYKVKYLENLPSELIAWYNLDGIPYDKIPEHNPECSRIFSGRAPYISSLSDGSEYVLIKTMNQKLKLDCIAANDVSEVYWYVNDHFLKIAKVNDPIFFVPDKGDLKISCADDKGRSTDIFIKVKYLKE